ncbi:MAG: response regulator [Myxococcota bacterium]
MTQYQALVVEDSPMMRQLIVFALRRIKSLAITEACDGIDALQKLQDTDFDIVTTDINMPNMDGLTLISQIRLDAAKEMPILVISTEGAQDDRERAFALGANAFMTKPIQAPKIIDVVKNLLTIP